MAHRTRGHGALLYEEGLHLYTQEITAAVRCAKAAGATEIVMVDCHSAGGRWTFNSLLPHHSMISMDDMLAAMASPPLTAMAIPMREMGATAVDLVVRRAGSSAPLPVQQVVLPMQPVLRASCRIVSVSD